MRYHGCLRQHLCGVLSEKGGQAATAASVATCFTGRAIYCRRSGGYGPGDAHRRRPWSVYAPFVVVCSCSVFRSCHSVGRRLSKPRAITSSHRPRHWCWATIAVYDVDELVEAANTLQQTGDAGRFPVDIDRIKSVTISPSTGLEEGHIVTLNVTVKPVDSASPVTLSVNWDMPQPVIVYTVSIVPIRCATSGWTGGGAEPITRAW